MQENKLPFRQVVFVCTNQRAEGDRVCCAAQGGADLHAALKEAVKERGLKARVRVCKAGCMDRCEQGPNVMLFPGDVWLSGVGLGDVAAIVDRITANVQEAGA